MKYLETGLTEGEDKMMCNFTLAMLIIYFSLKAFSVISEELLFSIHDAKAFSQS